MIKVLRKKHIPVAVVCMALLTLAIAACGLFGGGTTVHAAGVNPGEIQTKLVVDSTLNKVYGNAAESYTSFLKRTSGIPDDGETVASAYYIELHNEKAVVPNNAIEFNSPILADDLEKTGGITIRLYAHLSAKSPFYVKTSPAYDYSNGIYFYGLGMTGAMTDTPVWVPADIVQDEWIDFRINAYDASRLCDADGYVYGITVGARIQGSTDDDFYVGGPTDANAAYFYIRSISVTAQGTSEATYGELSTHTGLGNLQYIKSGDRLLDANHVNNPVSHYCSGLTPTILQTSGIPIDNGQVVPKAYRFTFHSWSGTTSKHSILFDKPLSVAEIEKSGGLSLRLFAHLSDSSTYLILSASHGIHIHGYGKGITGEASDPSVLIPANIMQNSWLDFRIPAETAVGMADENGMLYGLQYAARIGASNNREFYIGTPSAGAAYMYVKSVTLLDASFAEAKTLTYHLGDGETKSVSFMPMSNLENHYVYPTREGYIFAGWLKGTEETANGELYDFSLEVTEDVDVTAAWVKLHASPALFTGAYTTTLGRLIIFDDGKIDLSGIMSYYDSVGIDEDGWLIVARSSEVMVLFNLNELERKSFRTVTYYSFGKAVHKEAVVTGEAVTAYSTDVPAGFSFKEWRLDSASGSAYTFGGTLTGNISLHAAYTLSERANSAYASYTGTYYNPDTGARIVLGADKKAAITDASGTKSLDYRILNEGGFAYIENAAYIPGEINALMLEISGTVYLRLTTFLITYNTGQGAFAEATASGELSNLNTVMTITVSGGDYKAAKPVDPVAEGLSFVGWRTAEGDMYDFDSVLYKSVALYGVWEKATDVQVTPTDPGGCKSTVAGSGVIFVLVSLAAVCLIISVKRRTGRGI